ncbi:Protection of telomeres protein 1 [Colletotrichum fructicola]|nr:Protection of telomeres protein 1 [Colletotrichum fructicola]KAF4929437.1 Protection of telomeres protein 1 [Colletotrichum fructicola]KAF5504004.1 Protection of telomeres protein 1 [Colletotrichum fructicola]
MAETNADMDLPKGFTALAKFMEEGQITPWTFVDVIGVVKDFRAPMKTRNEDMKCVLRLIDISIQDQVTWDVELNIFRVQEKDIPICGPGDIVVVHQAKVQKHSGSLSLLTNRATTAIHVYPASKIPPYPQPASQPLTPSMKDAGQKSKPGAEKYVSWLHQNIKAECIPDAEVFATRVAQSIKGEKQKLCELQEVRDGTFRDLIVQVVKDPFDSGDKVTLYVSDYTENTSFYNHAWKGQTQDGGRDGDPYGYTSGKAGNPNAQVDWAGPFGKRCIQITCYEPHASLIRSQVKCGDWVHLLNIQIKFGNNGLNLEGFLRQDRTDFARKMSIEVLDPQEDPENVHPALKNAIRRKRNYEKEFKAQKKEIDSVIGRTSKKRSAPDQAEKPLNSKQRRALQRAQLAEKAKGDEKPALPAAAPLPDLNPLVTCEHHDKPTSLIPDILEPATYEATVQGSTVVVKLPFTVAQYRANVRVIDFHPPRLEDFASGRKRTEYDILSDNSDSESDSNSEEEDGGTLDNFVGERVWEWRFALRLQEATLTTAGKKHSPGTKNNTFWVLVDNLEAQLLTGLDACNLRTDPDELSKLREKMFILWGDLEEKKSKALIDAGNKKKTKASNKTPSDRPPLDSSDAEMIDKPPGKGASDKTVSNRPFTCCVRQYGVQVKEPNETKADAGFGKRWERVFGLFGTKICGG